MVFKGLLSGVSGVHIRSVSGGHIGGVFGSFEKENMTKTYNLKNIAQDLVFVFLSKTI